MELKELYEIYGSLAIQLEIVNGKMMEIKRQIADKINGNIPSIKPEEKKSD